MSNKDYKGIEEALTVAEGFSIGCDYKTAFLFLKKSTGQVFTQLFCEATDRPSHYDSSDMLYLGKLFADTTYKDIMNMITVAYAKELAAEKDMEDYLRWMEEQKEESYYD